LTPGRRHAPIFKSIFNRISAPARQFSGGARDIHPAANAPDGEAKIADIGMETLEIHQKPLAHKNQLNHKTCIECGIFV
jgi:hypothetical protein